MQLAELLKDWPCSVTGGSIRTEITGVEDYAQAVQPGDIFIVRKGKNIGSRFVKEALARGAAIVSEESISLPIIDKEIPFVWVPNTALFLSYASAKLRFSSRSFNCYRHYRYKWKDDSEPFC